MARRIPNNGSVSGTIPNGVNTYIGANETFLDRNAKLIPSDETTMALTNMNWIAGHHTVNTLDNLYNIPDFILSQECYADKVGNGADALGQLWYVEDASAIYMLVNWNERRNINGWSKTNIRSVIGPDGKVNVSYFNTNSDEYCKTYGPIKEKSTEWITSITMYGDGTYTYSTDGLHFVKSNSTYTYSSNDSTSTFNVIDSINYNPSNDNPHQISYNVKEVKVLSQNHHTGSFKGDFLTSASLSNTGTLSGSTGKFTNVEKYGSQVLTKTDYNPTEVPDFLDTDTGEITCAPGSNIPRYTYGTYIVSNVSIDSNGTLSYSRGLARNWLHDNIVTENDSNNVWYTYQTNGVKHVGYIPVATISGDNLDSYEYTAGVVNKDFINRYETKINAISVSYNNALTYLESSYSYIKEFIDKNVLINSITSYSGPASTYIGYNINDKLKLAYINSASSTNQGPLSAYTYNYFNDHVTDVENRLNAKEITKSKQLPSPKVKWIVYKSDGTTQVGSVLTDKFSITVERGCYVKADDISITWPKGTNYMVPLSTNGTWGNDLNTAIKSNDANSLYLTVNSISWPKRQITSLTVTGIYQTLTGITTYGANTLITKQNSIGEWVLQRKNAANTLSSTDKTMFSINISQPINYWYGFTFEDPTKWQSGANITDLLINTIERTTNNGISCFTKGTTSKAQITIVNGSPIRLDNTTDGSPGYFIYIYRTEYNHKLKSAILNNSTDITPSFLFSEQKKVKITSRTNGYVQEYWVLWSSGINAMNYLTKFDLS